MELGDGMVAVVRGLPDAALAVTLLEGNRQYTLMPNAVPQQNVPAYVHVHQKPNHPAHARQPQRAGSPSPQRQYQQQQNLQPQNIQHQNLQPQNLQPNFQPQYQVYPVQHQQQTQQLQPHQLQPQQQCSNELQLKTHLQCNSSAQVVDGRYASVYKMSHCNVQPTSPPVQLTEFPPQRAELCRGHGNFEVGGLGSGGANFSPTRANNFRGAMNWPDRGAVFSPRASQEPDAFASSLRKYPALSPERSSEMLERLINYSQNKNMKCQPQRQGSPSRGESTAGSVAGTGAGAVGAGATGGGGHCCDRRTSITASLRSRNDSDYNFRTKQCEECPTRDVGRYSRSYEVRHLRDVARRSRYRNLSTYPYSMPVCPSIKERYDHLPPEGKPAIPITKSVNMETQAEIVKVSKEVATVPKEKVSKRDVAVPLSPCASHFHSSKLQLVSSPGPEADAKSCKSIQTCKPKNVALKIRKSAQTCSSIEIPRDGKNNAKIVRKIKSQEELRLKGDDDNLLLLIKKESVKYGIENKKEEISVLLSDLLNVNKKETIYFVNNVVYNLKDIFNKPPPLPDATRQQNLLVYRNDTSMQTTRDTTDFSISGIIEQDIINNIERYKRQLIDEINHWMANIRELDAVDIGYKQAAAHELAADIVDRHRYLELNPDGTRGSEEEELDNLRYQIFKRVNKLEGAQNMDLIAHASTLMRQIQVIPVPMFALSVCPKPDCCCHYKDDSNSTRSSGSAGMPCRKCQSAATKNEGTSSKHPMEQRRNQSYSVADSWSESTTGAPSRQETFHTERRMSMGKPRGTSMTEAPSASYQSNRRLSAPPQLPPGAMRPRAASQTPPSGPGPAIIESRHASTILARSHDATQPSIVPSLDQLNDQYDEYLINWVHRIPIPSSDPQEEAQANKMRQGIYNGVWKAITKIKMNPTALGNEFYYQDLLDEEVEELLNLLPENPDLIKQKKNLKSELVAKTTDFHKQLVFTHAATSFKDQLIESVTHSIPRGNPPPMEQSVENINQIVEEIQKLNLAEDFIMYTRFKEENKAQAHAYQHKLDRHIQELLNEIKRTQGKEIKDIDLGRYRDEIMAALLKVPLPSNETIRDEADEILIGIEVDEWFNGIPLRPPVDHLDSLCKRRHKNVFAKKIHDMGNLVGLDCYEDHLRQEIYKFMEKLPINHDQVDNVEDIVEPLINRLKNKHREHHITGSGLRRPSFGEPSNYDDFSRDMQRASSFIGQDTSRARDTEDSYLIYEGERVGPSRNVVRQYVQPNQPESEIEWMSLLEDTKPPSIKGERPGQRSVAVPTQESAHVHTHSHMPPTPHYAESRSPSRRTSASIQTAPSVKIQDEVIGDDGPKFSPRHETSAPMRGSLRRKSQGSQPPVHSQSYSPEYPRPGLSGHARRHSHGGNSGGRGRSPGLPETSTRPYTSSSAQADLPRSGEPSQRQSVRADAPEYEFSSQPQPRGFSTPHQPIPAFHESRPRRRPRELDRSVLEAARQRLDLEDTEDSEREELRCRCLERVWRCRKKMPMYIACDDFDMDFPPCFPVRCSCPYYY